ncbi:MAG TPA: nitrile hydratase subunit alpha, partial [Thermoanaerobaculia bacterium]
LVRVWTDAAYREKFLADPRAALAQEGWQIPDQIGVSIAANSDRSHVVVPLPKRPEGVSEQELHRIAREIFICC